MTAARNIRTNFSFYPSPGTEPAWRGSLENLERALREAFPDPYLEYRTSAVHSMIVLDFEVALAPDVFVSGTAAMQDADYAFITLVGVTADEAGTFALWLRDHFTPAPHTVHFASSLAMSNGVESPTPLTPDGDASEVTRQLHEHLAAIDAEPPLQ
ncbi:MULTISPECIES: hypothetical protein [unclassified Streptomyces]|uniref:hypothetical protein n=1 Tax=unclassified Streptomyces TaxID=2593676 RepID=UPI0033D8B246